jgi:hypothetical protein
MSSQSLIQYLEAGAGSAAMNRQSTEYFLASATVAAGAVLCFDITKTDESDKALYVKPADKDSANTIIGFGVALEAASAGDKVKVCLSGFCYAKVPSGAAAGTRYQVGSTAGTFAAAADISEGGSATVPQLPILAIGAAAEAGGKALCFVYKSF